MPESHISPSTKPAEIDEMARSEPQSLALALLIEAEAAPRSTTVEGLWRKATKKRPGSWTEYVTWSGAALPALSEAAGAVFEPSGADGPQEPPGAGMRFAVGARGVFSFHADFLGAVKAARSQGGDMHVWLAGAWARTRATQKAAV